METNVRTSQLRTGNLLIAVMITILASGPAQATPIVDQEHIPINGLGGLEVTANQAVGQAFTVGIRGLLEAVVITQVKHHQCAPTDPLNFELFRAVGGLPVALPVASGSAPPMTVPAISAAPGPVTFNIRSFGINVVTGDQLVIKLSSAAPGSGCTYAWSGEVVSPSASYPGGDTILFFSSGLVLPNAVRDMAFRTLVDPTTPPTADAGDDKSVRAGETVTLDGSGSFDDNTPAASLTYSWSLASVPDGSNATLEEADTANASLVADVAGEYVVELVVADQDGLLSAPDQVVISSDNMAPTSAAGPDQLVVVGATVNLSGLGSSDPENDQLGFQWTLSSVPIGSSAVLVGETTATPSFVADVSGVYDVTLAVSDALGPGAADSASVVATSVGGYTEYKVLVTHEIVMSLEPGQVTTQGNQTAFANFLNQAVVATQSGDPESAIRKLRQAISRADGCALRGTADVSGPDRDWITDCARQIPVYTQLVDALDVLLP